MKAIFLILFSSILLMNVGSVSACCTSESSVEKYTCPMKCEGEKIYEKPGKCPVCHMSLEKVIETIPSHSTEVESDKVTCVGSMKNVMHKGELFGTINLDTISDKQHLYGLGPIEYLKGEILIDNGISYLSKVGVNGTMIIEETYKVKAPFFVYENVSSWKNEIISDNIQTIPELEVYLDQISKNHSRPFAFKLTGTVESANIHIVNLPKGTKVHSPEEAHQNQKNFILKNEDVELIGFFSTKHQGVFTQHDSYVHIHLLSADKKKMGHLEEMLMKKGSVKLFLGEE